MTRSRLMPSVATDELVRRDASCRPGCGRRSGSSSWMAPRKLPRPRPGAGPAAAPDAQDRARQEPRVAVVQAEPARVGVDVAERVGQQVEVAVLEDLDRAEVRGLHDRDRSDREERDRRRRARGRRGRAARGRHVPFAPSPPVSSDRRSAWSAMTSASIRSSRSPSMTPGRLWTVLPIRWSVTRSCGKL